MSQYLGRAAAGWPDRNGNPRQPAVASVNTPTAISCLLQLVVGEYGGNITCDSQIGQGTRFTIHLPLAGAVRKAL